MDISPHPDFQIDLDELLRFAERIIYQNQFTLCGVRNLQNILADLKILSELRTNEIIQKLRDIEMPKKVCGFQHHILGALISGRPHTPYNCHWKERNPSCGHMDINGIAPLLILGEFLVREKKGEHKAADPCPLLAVLTGPKQLDTLVSERGVPNGVRDLQTAYGEDVVKYAHQLADQLEEA